MNGFIKEFKERPGDWIFLPIFFTGLCTLSWHLIVGAFLAGAIINAKFGVKP